MNNYDKLIGILREIFQIDQADLDFGIYRIMNQKREEINDFLENKLLPQVKTIIQEANLGDASAIKKDLEKLEAQLRVAEIDPETSPKVQRLREQLQQTQPVELIEEEVFSHLSAFFKRYYDKGDFISLRRYKKDVYAIPYEGEEVKLYWANHDQYYIKSSEYLKNYQFKVGNKKVKFELVEANTEQNNNKAEVEKERQFRISEERPLVAENDTLTIYFTYLPSDKKAKREELNAAAFETVKNHLPTDWMADVLQKVPTKSNGDRTILEKHINDFTARNTFDYFIHKDLGGFLRRELDFYIKNEVLHLDDIDTSNDKDFVRQLTKLKALRTIAGKVIAFLEQLENFQKRLWLKKKFVVETNYCITLDKIPESYYPEIAKNESQWEEWERLFSINDISKDELTGKEIPRVEFLQHQPYLVLDTAFFNTDFKGRLLAEFEDLEAETAGLLINSENFQALELLQKKFRNKVQAIYIDPPYNKGSDFAYKDNFRHSSWISFSYYRTLASKPLLVNNGVIFSSIDKNEIENQKRIFELLFSKDQTIILPAITNLKGNQDSEGFASTHEYVVCGANNTLKDIRRLNIDEETLLTSWSEDEYGLFKQADGLRATGANAPREKRQNLWYPIFINPDTKEFYTTEDNLPKSKSDIPLYPINDKGQELSWYWKKSKVNYENYNLILKSGKNGYSIYKKQRPGLGDLPTRKPKTILYSPEYSSTNGGNLTKEIFGKRMSDFTPKSVKLLSDLLFLGGDKNSLLCDYFAGSGTAGHAVINLNREDNGNRRYILVEMGEYFDTVTKPRIQKVIYSANWKDGKPTTRKGSSHLFKYIRLESYEDTLNNLRVKRTENQANTLGLNDTFYEEYLLGYMLDTETSDSLLSVADFKNPFNYQLTIQENNEPKQTVIDMVETFNYLIGLKVQTIKIIDGFRVVTGIKRTGESTLVIWRNQEEKSNDDLETFFKAQGWHESEKTFQHIYVNGDNTLANLKKEGDTWQVYLTEKTFLNRMFDVQDL